ncbi:MAG: hypothetical protein QM783_08615 [Phycisphaerales bacterium]
MERLGRNGDPSDSGGGASGIGDGVRELIGEEIEQLSGVLVRLGHRVREGTANAAEARAAALSERELEIDLAAAAAWSPSLVLCALVARPDSARVVAAIVAAAGVGEQEP